MIKKIKHGNSGIDVFEYKGQKAVQKFGVEKAFDLLYDENKFLVGKLFFLFEII